MEFKPRFSAPLLDNPYYRHWQHGGVNRCIHIAGGSCIPNCTGYAFGRIYELTGTLPRLSTRNAENWFGTMDGYKHIPAGKDAVAKLGAIACWRKGSTNNGTDGCGHVAIVENYDNTYVWLSESNYNGKAFNVRKIRRDTMELYAGAKKQGYVFQGYIYVSDFEAKKPVSEIAKEVIVGKWGNGTQRRDNLTKARYDYATVQAEVNRILRGK